MHFECNHVMCIQNQTQACQNGKNPYTKLIKTTIKRGLVMIDGFSGYRRTLADNLSVMEEMVRVLVHEQGKGSLEYRGRKAGKIKLLQTNY